MNIVFKNKEMDQFINSEGINYFLGANQSGKTYILELLKDGFTGQNKNFLIDGLPISKNDYNIIYFDDTTDFSNEFKFTKNNNFRKLIYDNILQELDEDNILEKVNNIFNKIDDKVNNYLDLKINSKSDNNIKFDIEIDNINDIVDKFTNIYIDNYILNEDNIPRSTRRKLIYELLLLKLDENDKPNIVIIDNFDLYLDYENTGKIIRLIEKYVSSNDNTHFFLSSSNNIYELIKNKNSIFHTKDNKIIKINDLKSIIEDALIKEAYINDKENDKNIEEYRNNNAILYIDEIDNKYKEIMNKQQYNMGKLYINSNIDINEMIFCENLFYYYFFEFLNKELNK